MYRFITYLMILLFFVLAPLLNSYSATTITDEKLSFGDIVGIWKICYSPRNTGGPEVDGGYLVILPDKTFNRFTNGDDFGSMEPQRIETGTYKIINHEVFFYTKTWTERDQPSSKNYPPANKSQTNLQDFSLIYVTEAEIVFSDNENKILKCPVLKWKWMDSGDFDYCYAKLY